MKHAYVSIVIPTAQPLSREQIRSIDLLLAQQTRLHEIVLVVPFSAGVGEYSGLDLAGPVTTVITQMRATPDAAVAAGLARAVGDFVLEWRGSVEELGVETLEPALDSTDSGSELVEIVGKETSAISGFFYRVVNSLRPRAMPVRKTVGRLYSRHCLGQLLAAISFEPQLDVLAAELPVTRALVKVAVPNPHRDSILERIGDGGSLLSKGTRFGSTVPLLLASVSAFFGVGAALYAMSFFILRGQTPEGWTTLMIVLGLGQAAVLAMLGLVWSRINAMTRGLSQRRDPTSGVIVTAPSREHGPE